MVSPTCYLQFSSVTQSCLTLCDPMNCSMPGLPVHLVTLYVFKLQNLQSWAKHKKSSMTCRLQVPNLVKQEHRPACIQHRSQVGDQRRRRGGQWWVCALRGILPCWFYHRGDRRRRTCGTWAWMAKGKKRRGMSLIQYPCSLGRWSSLNLNWPTELDIPPSTRSGE